MKVVPGLQKFNEYIGDSSNPALFKLFFDAGFDYTTLQENVRILLKTADQKTENTVDNQSRYLVHMFMPSYCADMRHLKDTLQPSVFHTFLKESALFYKRLYEEQAKNYPLDIRIVIPKLEYFTNMIEQDNPPSKLSANIDVLHKELTQQLDSSHNYILMDQDADDLKPMILALQEKGIQATGASLPITNSKGYPTKKFNPYIVQPDSTYTYQTSPLFNQHLVDHVHAQYKEKACE